MPRYIADCKGFTTGEYSADSDTAAWRYALDWARETFSNARDGIVEVWDVRSDTLLRSAFLEEVGIGRR